MKDKKEVKKTPAKKAKAKAPTQTTITAYKGFDSDWKCRGFQYEVGKTYEHMGEVKACQSGFHACEHPLDVFGYYPPAGSRFALVEQSGITDKGRDGDSKIASRTISIKAEIDIPYLVKAAIDFTKSKCLPIDPSSPASATGDRGAASATGERGAASATGGYGAASATGYKGAASATGYKGAASATGDYGVASATGYRGAASATGEQGAASATGGYGATSATGYKGAASATGDYGVASATGYKGAASATGDYGVASATGEASVAISTGYGGKTMARNTGAIVLVSRDASGNIKHIRASKVGDNGIKPDTWYELDDEGQFVECMA